MREAPHPQPEQRRQGTIRDEVWGGGEGRRWGRGCEGERGALVRRRRGAGDARGGEASASKETRAGLSLSYGGGAGLRGGRAESLVTKQTDS